MKSKTYKTIQSLLATTTLITVASTSANPIGDQLAGQLKYVPKKSDEDLPFNTRSANLKPPVRTETQTIFTTRSVASSMFQTRGPATAFEIEDEDSVEQTLESDGKVKVKVAKLDAKDIAANTGAGDLPAAAGEEVVAIEIKVDPDSQLQGQVNFVKNTAIIKDDSSFAFLAQLIDALNNDAQLKGQKFIIQGHASTDGDVHRNLELSQQRADAIFENLRQRGVEPNRIFAVGVGEQHARHGEDKKEELRALDRRVILYRLES